MKLALACLLLLACGSRERVYTIALADSTTAEQEALATAAADEWASRVEGLTLRVARIGAYSAESTDTIWLTPVASQGALAGHTTWNDGAPGAAKVNVSAWSRDVLLHELGHAMGLAHATCGVMRGAVNPYRSDGLQACDVAQYREVWGAP